LKLLASIVFWTVLFKLMNHMIWKGAQKVAGIFTKPKEEDLPTQGKHSSGVNPEIAKRSVRTNKVLRGVTLRKPNMENHAFDMTDPVVKNVNRNTCILTFQILVDDEIHRAKIFGFSPGKDLIVFPSHVLLRHEGELLSVDVCFFNTTPIRFMSNQLECYRLTRNHTWRNVEDFNDDDDNVVDIAAMRIPGKFNRAKISQHFMSREEKRTIVKVAAIGLRSSIPDVRNGIVNAMTMVKRTFDVPHSERHTYAYEGYIIDGLGFQNGDCGILVEHDCSSISGRYLGFHVAGKENLAYVIKIPREDLEELVALSDEPVLSVQSSYEEFVPDRLADEQKLPKLHFIGKLPPKESVQLPRRNKLHPSPISNQIEDNFGPATTAPSIVFEPSYGVFHTALAKQGNSTGGFDTDLMLQIRGEMVKEYSKLQDRMILRPLEEDEIVNGIPPCYGPIDIKTSPGYPYVLHKEGFPGKKKWIHFDAKLNRNVVCNREFVEEGEAFIKRFNEGEIPNEIMFVNVLKAERLPVEKIKMKKSRLFCYTSISFLYVVRKLFGAYVRNLEANHQFLDIAIGMNPISEDWDIMVSRMLTNGDKFLCGDYSKFDSTIPYEMGRMFADHVSDLYDDEYRVARRTIMATAANSKNLLRDSIYQQYQGNPSGFPLTSVYNSFCNSMFLWVAYCDLTGFEVSSFREHVCLKVMGDDNIMSVSDLAVENFHMQNIASYLAEYGLQYTYADKTAATKEFVPLSEATFLKRNTKYRHGKYYGCMPIQELWEMLRWNSRSFYEEEDMDNMCVCFQIEMSQYGQQVYDTNISILKNMILENNKTDGKTKLRTSCLRSYKQARQIIEGSDGSFQMILAAGLTGDAQGQVFPEHLFTDLIPKTTERGKTTGELSLVEPFPSKSTATTINFTNQGLFTLFGTKKYKKRCNMCGQELIFSRKEDYDPLPHIRAFHPAEFEAIEKNREILGVDTATAPTPSDETVLSVANNAMPMLRTKCQSMDSLSDLPSIKESIDEQVEQILTNQTLLNAILERLQFTNQMDPEQAEQESCHTHTTTTLEIDLKHADSSIQMPKLMRTPFCGINIGSYTQRLFEVASFQWTPSQTSGTQITTLLLPDLLLSKIVITDKMKNCLWFRWNVIYQIQLNVVNGNYGALMCVEDPAAETRGYGYTMNSYSSFPHVKMLASNTTSISRELKYLSVKEADMNPIANDTHRLRYTLRIFVLSPLSSAFATPTPVTVRVLANFSNLEMMGFTNQGDITDSHFQKAVCCSDSRRLANSLSKRQHGFGQSKQVTCLKKIVPEKYNPMRREGQPTRTAGHIQEGTVKSNYAMACGTNEDNMLNSLFTVPFLQTTDQIQSSYAAGMMNWARPVTPVIPIFNTATSMCASNATILSLNHSYWRGGMRYLFIFHASNFHTVRMRLSYDPKPIGTFSVPSQTDIELLYNLQGFDFEVKGYTEVAITIPYSQMIDKLAVPKFTGQTDYLALTNMQTNGVLYLNQLTTLAGTTSLTNVNPINYNVFMSAAPDMEFYDPILRNITWLTQGFDDNWENQMEAAVIAETTGFFLELFEDPSVILAAMNGLEALALTELEGTQFFETDMVEGANDPAEDQEAFVSGQTQPTKNFQTTNTSVVARFSSKDFKATTREAGKYMVYNAFCKNIQCLSTIGRTSLRTLRTVREFITIPGQIAQGLSVGAGNIDFTSVLTFTFSTDFGIPEGTTTTGVQLASTWLMFFSRFFAFRRGGLRVIVLSNYDTTGFLTRNSFMNRDTLTVSPQLGNILSFTTVSMDTAYKAWDIGTGFTHIKADEAIDFVVPYSSQFRMAPNSNFTTYTTMENANNEMYTTLGLLNPDGVSSPIIVTAGAGEDFTFGHLIAPGNFSIWT